MNILLVSYHFYNSTAEGLATARVAQGLVDRGHKVVVITSELNRFTGDKIEISSGHLKGIHIYRANYDRSCVPQWWRKFEKAREKNWLTSRLSVIPNVIYGCGIEEWAWVTNATRQAEYAWSHCGPFDIMHTRLNHAVSHYAGIQIVDKIPNLPWCAYFSDPYPHHLYPPPYTAQVGMISRITLERKTTKIFQRAGSIVFPARRLQDFLLIRKWGRFKSKSFIAPHLKNIWQQQQPPKRGERFIIRHSGFLMRERKIEPLFEGVRLFLKRYPVAKECFRLEFAGRYPNNELPETPLDLKDMVSYSGYKLPDELSEWLQGADVFLLVEAKLKEGIFFPTKFAEYLGNGRPILALSPQNGEIADLLVEGGGILVEPDEIGAIGNALEELFLAWKENRLEEYLPNIRSIQKVSAEHVIPIYENAFNFAIRTSEQMQVA
jgi:glycosyltransferase involved in cell wall biosynthesis